MTTPENQARTPGGLVASEPFVSAHTRATVVVVLFAAYVVVAASSVLANVARLALPPVVIAAAEGDQEQLTLGDLAEFFIALATLFVFVALVTAFCVWLHRAAKNVPALGNAKAKVEHSPGWAVGSFFVPFVNLVVPYRAVKEVWVKSDPAVRTEEDFMFSTPSSAPPLLLGWWVAWLVSNFVNNISWRLQAGSTLGTKEFVAGVDIVSELSNIVAAVLAVMVVRGIDRRQAERARLVTYVPHMPPPPPIFTPPSRG